MKNSSTADERVNLTPLVVFTLLYLLPAIVGAVVLGNKEFLFYIAVMAVLIAVAMVLHKNVGLSAPLLWCMSIWGLLHMAGGLVPVPEGWPIDGKNRVLYSLWLIPNRLKYDQVIHAYGFGVTTWACWHVLRATIAKRLGKPAASIRPEFGLLSLCVAAGMGFGAFNEVVEFVASRNFETNVGGYENTGWDLVSNMTGCLIAATVIYVFGRRDTAKSK